MAEWIASDAAKVGIRIKLQTMEWISYLHAWAGGMPAGIGLNQQSWGMTFMYWPNLPLRSTSGLNVGHQPNKQNLTRFSTRRTPRSTKTRRLRSTARFIC